MRGRTIYWIVSLNTRGWLADVEIVTGKRDRYTMHVIDTGGTYETVETDIIELDD